MKAMDVMVRDVITVSPGDDVADAVQLLADYDVSALPVVDDDENVVGIISEADLLHREEIGTETRRPWWLEAVTPASSLAGEFAKSHGRRVEEVMSTNIIAASEDTPLGEIATLLERHRIKRVPILRSGKLVGIVSRETSFRRWPRPKLRPAPPSAAAPIVTATSAARCLIASAIRTGPISASATSSSATASSTCGAWSARPKNTKPCWRWRKVSPASSTFRMR